MTWLGLALSLLFAVPVAPGAPAQPQVPEPTDAWGWGRRLSDLRAAVAKPPLDADALWGPFAVAPSPVAEEAAWLLARALPEPAARRRLLRRAFPTLAGLADADGPPRAARWLTEASCTAPARLAVLLEWIPLMDRPDQAGGWEFLWDTLPGHPEAFSWLLAAVEAASRADQQKDLARLRRVQLMFLPHTLDAAARRDLIAALPCPRRPAFLRIAHGLGSWDAVLELLEGCPDPAWEARARYQRGEYAQALALVQALPPEKRPEALELRLASLALSADQLAERYAEALAKDPSEAARRRLIKTRMLAGQYGQVVAELEKDTSAQYRFLRGLAAWQTRRTALARRLWGEPADGEDAEERVTRQFWLATAGGPDAGGPDGLDRPLDPARPMHAYYHRLRQLSRRRDGADTVSRALALVLPRRAFSDRDLTRLARAAPLTPATALAFSLWSEDFTAHVESCLLDLMSMRASRYRSQLDLWRCPHFADGHPDRCPQTPVTASDLPGMLASWTAAVQDWPVLQGAGRPFLPQPHRHELLEAARRFEVPAALLWAVMQTESSFHPRVISRAGAVGLFQVIPPTGAEIAAGLGRPAFHPGALLEPATAAEFGAYYLGRLAREFDRHWPLVAAAYNAGPHQVRRWLKRPSAMATDAWVEEIPFEETRRYVKLVLGRATLYARQIGEPPPAWPASVPVR